ncbi:imm11 family protein [Pontibacillus sp. HMF3514]|uniref:imm11 family protein n=1 Tax=Pontibacillus sp. HMF3514 TaxID=2692425 RepID=UPI00131FBDF4|nr:DUF1629 domain-containing protein [Pontibacillus sp. HMF3514]
MKYYKLMLDVHNEDDIVCYCEDSYGFEQYELDEGKFIEEWNKDITFYYHPKEGSIATDYLANDLGWFIVSSKFKNILENMDGISIQFLPVNIINSYDHSQLSGYYVANILTVLDALNLEGSDYSVIDLDDEKFYNVKKYAVSKNRINQKNVFKLKGDEIPVFISGVIKEQIEEELVTGCDFLEIKVI